MKKYGLLLVSFGSSYQEAVEENIVPVEEKIRAAFPEYEFRRAFSSRKIVKKLRMRDGITIDTPEEALERLAGEGFTDLIVQPTFVIHGYESDELKEIILNYRDRFSSICVGAPLIHGQEDMELLIRGLVSEYAQKDAETAVVFMGHGTEHIANACYPALDSLLHESGHAGMFVGTVEGYPELATIRKRLAERNFRRVILAPLMLVAGDHARNDMAGEEKNSWKSVLERDGYEVECRLDGLGSFEFIQEMFLAHARDAK